VIEVKVVDNFLDQEVFKQLQDVALGGYIPWFYSSTSVQSDDGCPQFSHTCYNNLEPTSQFWEHVKPVIAKINPLGLSRIKFNCTPRTPEIVKKPLHYDITFDMEGEVPATSSICILYLNDNDGYTYFETGDKIESVANRAVFFPCNIKHGGTTCTDQDRRVLLNINFS